MARGWQLKRLVAIGLLAATALSASATADVSNTIFTITATNDLGTGSWSASFDTGWWDPSTGAYHWDLPGSIDLTTSDGGIVATLNDAGLTIFEDPQVDLNFAVSSGASSTIITIDSALVSFPMISDAMALASVGMTLTDNGGTGATLVGLQAGGGSYLAQYNGMVPGGTTFTHLITILNTGAFGTTTASSFVPMRPIHEPVSDISSQFSFMLTANASASGTSTFVVIPSPGALALLAIAGLLGVRRRRTG